MWTRGVLNLLATAALTCAAIASAAVMSRAGVTFTQISAGLPGVFNTSHSWGDYDNDGDLDILLTGHTGSGFLSRIFRNDGSEVFTDANAELPGVAWSSVAWGDYDNDGDLDILLTGTSDTGCLSRVYRNDGAEEFVDIAAALPGVAASSVAWGDYDNDGDLDILLTGETVGEEISRVYRNEGGGVFQDIGAGLVGVSYSSVAWGDYDGDGDLDILLTGHTGSTGASRVYRNDGAGAFTDIGAALPDVYNGSVAWGDYDNDGDLDILLGAVMGTTPVCRVYRNDGAGVFTDIVAGLPGVAAGSVAWGDYDNDGDMDILVTGNTGSGYVSRVYRNDGAGGFADITAGLPGLSFGAAAWGDFDNDGDLDVLLAGEAGSGFISEVYRSDDGVPNTAPQAPGDLLASTSWDRITLSWSASSDGETPAAGLSYNLRIGTTPGGSEICSAMASSENGYRRVVQLGNAQQGTSWIVKLPPGLYYWSVQAVDSAYEGSPFATEESFRFLTFTDISAGLPGVRFGSAAWGDYDSDGDLDILLTGDAYWEAISRVYRNDGAGVFTDAMAELPGVEEGSAAWGDYDNDGDLDVLLTGLTDTASISGVYRNDGPGGFTGVTADLVGVTQSSAAWGDFDNDGDLDILLTGDTGSTAVSRVYRNDGAGTFTDVSATLPGVVYGSAAWGDYDNDGDLDILLTGGTGSADVSRVYRNDGAGLFTDIVAGLPGVRGGSGTWGDYDADGDLDILLTGDAGSTGISRVYRNDGAGVFSDVTAGLLGVFWSSAAWGDCDNDGDLDIVLAGNSGAGGVSRVYRNDGAGVFTDIAAGLPGTIRSSVAWGDYDNDGDLDVLLAGLATGTRYSAGVYRSEGAEANTVAEAPGDLAATVAWDQVTLSWSPSTDDQTPASGLSYNLRMGTSPGGSEIMVPMAEEATGYRRVAQLGNAQQGTSWTVTVPSISIYYWSVQAVDGAYAGSSFAEEESFERYPGAPRIEKIIDVPNDQGRQVRISWVRSGYDFPGSPSPITGYAIYRRFDEDLDEPPPAIGRRTGSDTDSPPLYPPGDWDWIMTVPACVEDEYAAVAPTLADSTASGGVYYTTFFARALTGTPAVYFDSSPDSGYSIDNLAPMPPVSILGGFDPATGNVIITWSPSSSEDLQYYEVHRGVGADFVPVYGNRVYADTDTVFVDTSLEWNESTFYKVAAVDFGGNRSDYLSISVLETNVPEGVNVDAGLRQNAPNPFKGKSEPTRITYSVEVPGGPVRISIYDLSGRLVRMLVDGWKEPGEHAAVWDGKNEYGQDVSAGVYLYRIEAPGYESQRKAVLLR